jgi:topoisomerase-4 subunit A
LGEFDTGDSLLVLYNDGSYEVTDMDVQQRFDMKEILHLCKFTPELGGERRPLRRPQRLDDGETFPGRNQQTEGALFVPDRPRQIQNLVCFRQRNPRIKYTMKIKGKPMTGEVALGDFMDVKGWKAVGNRLSDQMLGGVKEIEAGESRLLPKPPAEDPEHTPAAKATVTAQQASLFGEEEEKPSPAIEAPKKPEPEAPDKKTFRAGDTIEFD